VSQIREADEHGRFIYRTTVMMLETTKKAYVEELSKRKKKKVSIGS
jgi:hypothetical protein